MLVDIHGLRRGRVAVAADSPVGASAVPSVTPEEAFDEWVFSTKAVARMCTIPSAPPLDPKRIDAMRAALHRLAGALDVAEARAGATRSASHHDAE
ncbi:MAG: hypothetical protein KF764_06630 [Labilithrix sp.]|nr:hypothetical protein [Labilithrix sp.]